MARWRRFLQREKQWTVLKISKERLEGQACLGGKEEGRKRGDKDRRKGSFLTTFILVSPSFWVSFPLKIDTFYSYFFLRLRDVVSSTAILSMIWPKKRNCLISWHQDIERQRMTWFRCELKWKFPASANTRGLWLPNTWWVSFLSTCVLPVT